MAAKTEVSKLVHELVLLKRVRTPSEVLIQLRVDPSTALGRALSLVGYELNDVL